MPLLYRNLTISLFALILFSCAKNQPQLVDTTYPLDELSPDPIYHPLIITTTSTGHVRQALCEEERIKAEYLHPEAHLLNLQFGLTLFREDFLDLHDLFPRGDFPVSPRSYALGSIVNCTQLSSLLDTLSLRSPILSLLHDVRDSGIDFQVDLRIDFFKNFSAPRLYVQTYLLIDGLRATNITEWDPNDGDFRQLSNLPQLEDNYAPGQPGTSRWTQDRAFIGGQALIEANEAYYHRNVPITEGIGPQGQPLDIGINLNEFTGQNSFAAGTQIGTWRKPLRFLLPKPLVDPLLKIEGFSVLSVVWEERISPNDTLYIPLNAVIDPVSL